MFVFHRAAAPTLNARQSYILGELARQLENSAGEYLNLAEDVVAQQRKKASYRETTASNPKGKCTVFQPVRTTFLLE